MYEVSFIIYDKLGLESRQHYFPNFSMLHRETNNN